MNIITWLSVEVTTWSDLLEQVMGLVVLAETQARTTEARKRVDTYLIALQAMKTA